MRRTGDRGQGAERRGTHGNFPAVALSHEDVLETRAVIRLVSPAVHGEPGLVEKVLLDKAGAVETETQGSRGGDSAGKRGVTCLNHGKLN